MNLTDYCVKIGGETTINAFFKSLNDFFPSINVTGFKWKNLTVEQQASLCDLCHHSIATFIKYAIESGEDISNIKVTKE